MGLTTMRAKWAKKRMRHRQRKKRNYRLDRGVVGLLSSQGALTLRDDPEERARSCCVPTQTLWRRRSAASEGLIFFLNLKYSLSCLSTVSFTLYIPHLFITYGQFVSSCSYMHR